MHKKLNCILLIDDDEVNNFINENILRKLNVAADIKVVKNGLEALQFITTYNDEGISPELILLDLHMPVMDGFEFMSSFKKLDLKNKDKIEIAVLTSSDNPNDLKLAKNLGIKHYLIKPFKPDTVELFFNMNFSITYNFSDN
ncbi:MAG: response regulator [Cytophagaceae bacterium]|nr:response regulator [Cytophagaceae bacterium]